MSRGAHASRAQAPATHGLARFTLAGLLLAGGLGTWLMADPYRGMEAKATAWLADLVSTQPIWSAAEQPVIFVGRPVDLAFVITPSCSSMIVAVIFFVASGLLSFFGRRFRLRRILMAFAVAVVLALFINFARMILIVLASSEWSRQIGFQLSHEWLGSFLTVFGMAFALLVYLFLLARDRSPVASP
ncbi:MAG: archaeosortase/exosortase family protein [Longispora sp.]|nr:archaeosortase/exosortase family protein [Longispora sp. (in: high G+C Gram-positive bacteria)]